MAFSDGFSFNISCFLIFISSLDKFSALMKELSTYHNANAFVVDDGSQDSCSLAAHEMHERATMLRLQGMDRENANLDRNTKETYLTHLKLFRVSV